MCFSTLFTILFLDKDFHLCTNTYMYMKNQDLLMFDFIPESEY